MLLVQYHHEQATLEVGRAIFFVHLDLIITGGQWSYFHEELCISIRYPKVHIGILNYPGREKSKRKKKGKKPNK